MSIYSRAYSSSHALVIGIDEYDVEPKLKSSGNDAQAIADVLKTHCDFPSDNVHLLCDGRANRKTIVEHFYRYVDTGTEPDDRLILFFAGHGHTLTVGQHTSGFLIPSDGDTSDISTLIRWDELTRATDLIRAKHILFLIDACYGGLALARNTSPSGLRYAADQLTRLSRKVLTAGKANELVFEQGPRQGHSMFTGHLLEGLEKGVREAGERLTATALASFVHKRVAFDQYSKQSPEYGTISGDGDMILDNELLTQIAENPGSSTQPLVDSSPSFLPSKHEEFREIELLKELLTEERFRIRLNDFYADMIRAAKSKLSTPSFSLSQSTTSSDDFSERVARYDGALSHYQTVLLITARWAQGSNQFSHLEKLISPFAPDRDHHAIPAWDHARWYAPMRLLFVSGIAATAQQNWHSLSAIIKAPAMVNGKQSALLIETMAGWQKFLDETQNRNTGASDHLYASLQPTLEDNLMLGKAYEPAFERFEILLALCYFDLLLSTKKTVARIPYFRFIRKYKRHPVDNSFIDLVDEITQGKEAWPPLEGRLFSTLDHLQDLTQHLKRVLDNMPLR